MGFNNGYAARTYNLVASQPQALPPSRSYLIVSATVDTNQILINLGDGNGDFEQWPLGFKIKNDKGTSKARIQSTVNQSVTVVMADGDIDVEDSRVSPGGTLAVSEADGANVALGARADAAAASDAAVASLISLTKRLLVTRDEPHAYGVIQQYQAVAGSLVGSATIVAPGANVNGCIINAMRVSCLADPTADYYFHLGGTPLLRAYDSQTVALPTPITVPAGVDIGYNRVGGGSMSIAYRLL